MFKHFRRVEHPVYLTDGWAPMTQKWYCGHCIDPQVGGLGFFTAASAMSHVIGAHGEDREDLVEGEHYLVGTDLWVKLQRWHDECDRALAHFVNVLSTIETVEDFEIDFPAVQEDAA